MLEPTEHTVRIGYSCQTSRSCTFRLSHRPGWTRSPHAAGRHARAVSSSSRGRDMCSVGRRRRSRRVVDAAVVGNTTQNHDAASIVSAVGEAVQICACIGVRVSRNTKSIRAPVEVLRVLRTNVMCARGSGTPNFSEVSQSELCLKL